MRLCVRPRHPRVPHPRPNVALERCRALALVGLFAHTAAQAAELPRRLDFGWAMAPAATASASASLRAVKAGGPAEAAGLRPGDEVVSVDGQPVRSRGTS